MALDLSFGYVTSVCYLNYPVLWVMLFCKIILSKGNGLSFKSDNFLRMLETTECWKLQKIAQVFGIYTIFLRLHLSSFGISFKCDDPQFAKLSEVSEAKN